MEEGSLRCDANVSVRPAGRTELGTKTELKNMNSFRFLEHGINAEIARQIALLEAGETVVQETLHFDPADGRAELAALQGGGARLPLLPRARPRAGRADGGDARGARAPRCPSCPPTARRATSASWACRRDAARLLAFEPQCGRLLRGRRAARRRPTARAAANWVDRAARALGAGPTRPPRSHAAGAGAAGRAGQAAHDQRRRRPPGARPAGRRGRRAGRDRRARGPRPRWTAATSSRRSSPRRSRTTRTSPSSVRGGNPKAIGADRRPVMRETKGRADGGEVSRLIREQLGL